MILVTKPKEKHMHYCQLSQPQRIKIQWMSQAGYSIRKIAKRLGRSPSTISREIKRNGGKSKYNSHHAHLRARANHKLPRNCKLTPSLWREIIRRLKKGHTPEQISGRLFYEQAICISREAIYLRIYKESRNGKPLYRLLPRAKRQRTPRLGNKKTRTPHQSKLPSIDQRPASAQSRQEVGHWEGDLIIGSHQSGNLLTLVERTTLYLKIGKVASRHSQPVAQCLIEKLKQIPKKARKTLTLDNGCEFKNAHRQLRKGIRMEVYFAHPYHSWERGTNENTNGLIRRDYPKKTKFSRITESRACQIAEKWNNIPRKTLNWLSPREALCLTLSGHMVPEESTPQEQKRLNYRRNFLTIPSFQDMCQISAQYSKRFNL